MTQTFLYLLLDLVAGTFSGLIGIGGGTIIVPALLGCPQDVPCGWG